MVIKGFFEGVGYFQRRDPHAQHVRAPEKHWVGSGSPEIFFHEIARF